MNADKLLAHFEKISDAPDAVDRLRRFVLDLAVRGKLVDQDPRESVEASKASAAEEPFPLPSNWSCVALGGVLRMINGRAFKPSDWHSKGLPIVRIQNLNNESAPFNCCDPKDVDEKHVIESGTFLISWSGTPGTSFGAFIWQRGKAALNQHIFKCLPTGTEYLDRFLQLAINGRLDEMIAKAHGGVGLQHITKGKLEALALPLPPLAEQHRIVEKVDELMMLCDRLEASQAERESCRNRLVVSSLNRIGNPSGSEPKEFKKDAEFHLRNLNRLSTKPEHIKELRKAILNLAVRGKLVPQDEREGISSVVPKAVLIAEPHAVPSSWAWATLDDLIGFGPQNGVSPKPTERADAPAAITLTATTSGKFLNGYFKRVEASFPPDSEYWLSPGDLLFQRGNTREYVGIAAIYEGPPNALLYPDLMIKVRIKQDVDLRYVHLAATAPPARDYFSTHATGAQASMPKINHSILRALPIPIPPLAEQKRIVAKVDELMAICDQLEKQLETQQKDSRRLLEALLHEALEGVG
jgi:type I restriction enzyme S subunit